ncbi:MAG: AarF/ABC1/UbiB kinase family protein [Planctomycetales bacterium]|nr:AarF/ABC1/UbiB kinase family protein [Planctomycetales bacterium]
MKISSIPQLYRNLRRWQEIISVLRRYGLADWLSQLKLDFIRDWLKDDEGIPLASYSRERRIRLALTDLGPTFIKLGQVLSLRPDLIGAELANELTSLQSHVPADKEDVVRRTVTQELGGSIEQHFREFSITPIASASIGQVHLAKLIDGTPVVVKVQHAGIHETVREDLEVMAGLATLADRLPDLAVWKPKVLVEQLARSLRRELNFGRELQNLQQFEKEFRNCPAIRIPHAFPKQSTQRILTMELLTGVPVNQLQEQNSCTPLELQQLAKDCATAYIEMIFVKGLYHADPHPGNILVLSDQDGKKILGLLDFGMVGRLDDRLRETIEEMLLAVASRDAQLMTALIKRVGNVPMRLDEALLAIDVADLVQTYGSQPLDSFDLSGALNEVTEIMHRHQISLPPQTSLLIKMLVTLEGTLRKLAPEFSLLEVMQPFFRRMWIRRLAPARYTKRMRRIYLELESLIETLPSQISSVMQLVQEGRLDVHLSHKGLSPSVNRLVLGMLTSFVFLGSSILLAMQVPPLLFMEPSWLGLHRLSVFGLIGYTISLMGGLRLVLAINRSGHLDRSDAD